jgi:lysophospholipase L1-like esterase
MLYIRAIFIVLSIATASLAQTTLSATQPTSAPTSQPIDRYRNEIDAYLEQDRLHPPEHGGVVFVGSSSIRGWRTLKDDFRGMNVIGRGFGGSHLIDVIRHADALVLKHRPRVVVLYAGENDIASGRSTPEDVARNFETFCDLIHRELPEARIVVISMKPSPKRWKEQPVYERANALLREVIVRDARLAYVDVVPLMIDPTTGLPRPELYQKDQLHMTRAGYEIWRDAVKPYIE